MTKYIKCRVERNTHDGIETASSWIEESAASIGNIVKPKDLEGFWVVTSVYLSTSIQKIESETGLQGLA